MAVSPRRPLDEYLSLEYPFTVIPDPDGGYVITFPDLPGCLAQVETLDQVQTMVEEVRAVWIRTAYEQGMDIPLPSSGDYGGRFNVRLPRSLHRALAESAKRDGISLNQYVVMLLSGGHSRQQLAREITRMVTDVVLDALSERTGFSYRFGVPDLAGSQIYHVVAVGGVSASEIPVLMQAGEPVDVLHASTQRRRA
ncbi:MAG: type II toxin-antitoxin system HicB family antitoxin [Chloroflexi bacterium]|nr:type II toxin-antitoxin system HicB family antitoxin [Chloroflexota bacterium]